MPAISTSPPMGFNQWKVPPTHTYGPLTPWRAVGISVLSTILVLAIGIIAISSIFTLLAILNLLADEFSPMSITIAKVLLAVIVIVITLGTVLCSIILFSGQKADGRRSYSHPNFLGNLRDQDSEANLNRCSTIIRGLARTLPRNHHDRYMYGSFDSSSLDDSSSDDSDDYDWYPTIRPIRNGKYDSVWPTRLYRARREEAVTSSSDSREPTDSQNVPGLVNDDSNYKPEILSPPTPWLGERLPLMRPGERGLRCS